MTRTDNDVKLCTWEEEFMCKLMVNGVSKTGPVGIHKLMKTMSEGTKLPNLASKESKIGSTECVPKRGGNNDSCFWPYKS